VTVALHPRTASVLEVKKKIVTLDPVWKMLRSGARIASRATWRAAAVNGSVPVLSSARAAGVRSASSEVNNNVNTIYARTGLDPNYFRGRKVVIYKPPTGSTQNGKHSGSQWKLQ